MTQNWNIKWVFDDQVPHNQIISLLSPHTSHDYMHTSSFSLYIPGESGTGKTETVKQLFRQMNSDTTLDSRHHGVIEGFLDSSNPTSLINNIRLLCIQQSIEVPPLGKVQHSPDKNIGLAIRELFEVLQRMFPTHLKCVIFDNAHPSSDIINQIDQLPHKLTAASHWKVVVTTEKQHMEFWMNRIKDLKSIQGQFRIIPEFSVEETEKFFSTVDTDRPATQLIHQRFHGHPLSLKIVKEVILANRVSSFDIFGCLYRI